MRLQVLLNLPRKIEQASKQLAWLDGSLELKTKHKQDEIKTKYLKE